MKKDLEGMTAEEKKDYLHYNQEPAMRADPYITQAMEYTGDHLFEDYYETGEFYTPEPEPTPTPEPDRGGPPSVI